MVKYRFDNFLHFLSILAFFVQKRPKNDEIEKKVFQQHLLVLGSIFIPNFRKFYQMFCFFTIFFIFRQFWLFLARKGQKMPKPKRVFFLPKSKPFNEIFRNLVCRCFPTKENATIFFPSILAFFGLFLAKKQQNLIKNEETWQNPKCLIKFSLIWYVDASQQKKM